VDLLNDPVYYLLPCLITAIVILKVKRLYLSLLEQVGGRPFILLPASFSVPIHELSHWIVAKVFTHKIESMALFQPNKTGGLGYVEHSYKRTVFSPFSNALIGMAPLFGGYITVAAITLIIKPDFITLLNNDAGYELGGPKESQVERADCCQDAQRAICI
jgi:hypothetical protein